MSTKKPKASSEHKKIQELTEALQRERADVTNLRRQHDEQMSSLRRLVSVNVIEQLLPVIDNFERALKHVPKNLKEDNYIKGVQSIVKQFERVIEDMGVQRIKTVGEYFDPRLHEAVSMEEGDGSHEIITEEVQSGYKLDDYVIRHAAVKVSNK